MPDDKNKDEISALKASKRPRSEDNELEQEGKRVHLALQDIVDVEDHGDDKQEESKSLQDKEENIQEPSSHDSHESVKVETCQIREGLNEVEALDTHMEHLIDENKNLKRCILDTERFLKVWRQSGYRNEKHILDSFPTMKGVINVDASKEKNERMLQQ